jgi:predicted ArsR family transcriptional regulator
MHPLILHDLAKAHISDLQRQAGRHALGRAARRARQTPAKQGTPFMPAHRTAELIRRVLTLLGARRPERYPMPANPVQPRKPG